MAQAQASSANNIRYNGTGRVYANTVGQSHPGYDLGELESIEFEIATTKSKMTSTRNASRGTLLEVIDETESTLSFGLREQTEINVQMALMSSAISSANQSASNVAQTAKTLESDKYIDLGHINVFSTKITHGAIGGGGLYTIAETVTGGTSGATGKVGYTVATYLEPYNVSGTFVAGETLTGGTSAKVSTSSGVTTQEDVIVTNGDQSVRYTLGTDYSIDADYGYIREISATSTIVAHAVEVSYDYEAVTKNYMHALSASSVQKRIVFVTDKDDRGTRKRYTFHKVDLALNGSQQLLGDGAEILTFTGTVVKDTTQASGEEYYKVETMPDL